MGQASKESMEELRKKVHSYLAALTPEEGRSLRARFGLSPMGQPSDPDEAALRALAGELAKLKKKQR
jgi:hypothetical protein